jgi:hypothetical protein
MDISCQCQNETAMRVESRALANQVIDGRVHSKLKSVIDLIVTQPLGVAAKPPA